MSFDPAAATAAYIDSLGPEALAKAEAYTVGGHWILLWGVLVGALVTWLIVRSGLPDRLQLRLRGKPVRAAFLVSALVLALSSLLTLPWTLYTDYFRMKAYGRTSQPLGDWLGQMALSTAISIVLGALFFLGLYTLIRKAGKSWWVWSGGLVAAVIALMLLAGPVLIEPLFNEYKPLPAGEVRTALEVQAAKAGIPADRIFVYDGSRQSNNFTANVSGVFGSARIAISDVALHGANLNEVKAVTGHEIGHYVSGHIWRGVALFSALAMLFFFLADRLFPRLARLFGSKASIGDPAGLPILLFFASLAGLLAQPISSSFSRWSEADADRYSLETVNLPDALSSALVKTAEYRYPRPGRLEEILFYDHPSVERRVRTAMEWKAAHPSTPDTARDEGGS
ncbi:M48 family metallopeptidase [Sandaracinobacter neustonicus]|uniref:M48 family metallopeptidase n=1 Tax=Sandaracinobacter neustonicus TaxID=1715348 RepID=A0A501XPN1_9SPHN|nr:M48 family metallopeptidase [Sandaracinobacter neustonicus]TPE62480.1 M48 family metallopeptidase [Sandaracinobacter neustonicus]